jgi:exonuclease VII small subunit
MTVKQKMEVNLNENLKRLAEISAWFNSQKEIDLEAGLDKVKEAAALIKESKEKLNNLENEFKEIEKDFAEEEPKNALKENLLI